MIEPYPLLVERRLSRRLWGGNRLADFLGLSPAADSAVTDSAASAGVDSKAGDSKAGDSKVTGSAVTEPIAESWQVYSENRVVNGSLAQRTLREIAVANGAAFLGTASFARYGTSFPLLAKFIDAAQPLSIQVHPGDDYARSRESASGHLGKAEAWYILDAAPDAEVVWGFNRRMTPAAVRRAVADGELGRYVNRIPVSPGEVIYNPEGTVHAIGAGLFLFEIQQASDLTYRLYDYDRKGADGQARPLHLEQALEVADLEPGNLAKVGTLELGEGRRLLIESRHFAMEAIVPLVKTRLSTSPASLEILTVSRGQARLTCGAAAMKLVAGTSVVLPAMLGEYQLEGSAEVLRCYVPVG